MDITKKVAKLRFGYHANMLDACNILNQLGILKDVKAEEVMKNHAMNCMDCLARIHDTTVEELVKGKKS